MVGGRSPLTDEALLLLLRILPGLGDRRRAVLFADGASRHEALERALAQKSPLLPESRRLLKEALSGQGQGEALRRQVAEVQARTARLGIEIRGIDDARYPARLRELHDPPAVLFLRGHLPLLDAPMVALVGSRRSTPSGRRQAYGLARELSEQGITILSGMALGIDGAAHRGGLDGIGSTAAVLGRGPDRAYPLAHAALFQRLVSEGLLISEFAPGTGARAHHFPRRNRILATLPAAVVVVEAREKSGALLTADFALDLGVDVMVVPGAQEGHPASAGSADLLEQGATSVTCAEDVLVRIQHELPPRPRPCEHRAPAPAPAPAKTPLQALLTHEPRDEDALLRQSGLGLSDLLHGLVTLELEGQARREGGGWVRWPP
jgi:DNA processing protein